MALAGDGGDELFAGYRRYAVLRHADLWRLWPRGLTSLARASGRVGQRMARLADAACQRDPALRMALLLTVETRQEPPTSLLEIGVRRQLEAAADPFLAYQNCAQRFCETDPVQQMLLTDMMLQLPSQFLAKVDRATMACGLEARVPLLDEKVAKLAVTIPVKWKVRGAEKKIILRRALRGRVPDHILDAPKTGFGVPYEHWLRGPLHSFARDAVLSREFSDRFGFERPKLEAAFEEHRRGLRDRGFTLWKVFQLALWARERP